MPCAIYKRRSRTVAEQFRSAGMTPACSKLPGHSDDGCDFCKRVIPDDTEWTFACGESADSIVTCKSCNEGFVADFLCDYPVGSGKTCDLPLCSKCAMKIGEDKHLCELHWHEWTGKAKTDYVNPVGPRLVK